MRLRALVFVAAFGVVFTPGEVRAEWLLTALAGGAFGGGVPQGTKLDYGAAAGWMGKIVGFEVEVSHRPDFFEVNDAPAFLFSESSVASVMFNGLISVPSGPLGDRLRPYAAGGVGWLRSRIGGEDAFIRGNNSHVGFNVGGGLFAALTDRFDIRGDIRYFRDLQGLEGDSEFFNLGDNRLDFWRVTGGVTFRF